MVAAGLQPGQPAGHDAGAVVGVGALVVPVGRGLPGRRVVGVQRVDPRVGREVGRHGEPGQSPVALVVHLGGEVGEDVGGGVGEVVEDLDDAGLLRDEDPAVRREHQLGRPAQAAERDLVLEAGRQGNGRGLRAGYGYQRSRDERRSEHDVLDGTRNRHDILPAPEGGKC